MHWLNVCVNCFLNRWFCYWILKSCCYFEICNNFTAPRWQSAPHECPGFKATSTFSLLLPSWLLYFFPLDPCLPPAPKISNFGLYLTPKDSLLKCISPSPTPRFWSGRLGNLCCWLVPQRLGEAGFLLKRTHWGRGALWGTRLQTLRMMASSYWVSTLCFFASGFPSSPTHLK